MTEYIDRDALLKHKRYLSLDRYEIECVVDVDRIIEAQAADVAPVERGKWIDIFEYSAYWADLKSTIELTEQKCSNCSVVTTFKGAKQYLPDYYCPNCGARMEDEV